MPRNTKDNFSRLIDRYIDQLVYTKHLSETSPLFPHHIHIEPTNACNLRCIHCVQNNMTRKRGFMDFDVYTKIIDEIAPRQGAITLDVQGEPMLHKRIFDMIGYAKGKDLHVSLLTNGTLLTPEKSQRLLDLGLDRIVFSFDAVDKELYERIRVRSDYAKTLKNILTFLRLNLDAGSPVFVCASIIRQEATEAHLEQYKRYFSELPVDTIFVSALLNMSGYSSVADEIDLTRQTAVPREERPICRVPWENMTVNWDGRVCSCPLDFDLTNPVGDVREQTLEEIWNGSAFRKFRRAHMDRDYESIEDGHALCTKCNCVLDPEYDLRNYGDFAKKAIVRQAGQYAAALAEDGDTMQKLDDAAMRQKLVERMQELED